jgi:hypothetical protein
MDDEEPVVPKSWLQKQLTVEEVEAEYRQEGVPFGGMYEQWVALKSQMIDGDEIWEFSSSAASWDHLAGRAGLALVRNGKAIDCIVTIIN